MQKQVYFSVVIAAISFITVKKIQQASIDHYHFLREVFQKDGVYFYSIKCSDEEFTGSINLFRFKK